MARVNTNNTSLRFCTESSIGTPATSGWRIAEFNSIGAYGAEITTVVRRPISADRGRKKGTVTDLDSTAEFETDLTMDAFTDFAEGFVFAEFANKEFDLKASGGILPPPAASSSAYTIGSASALLAGKIQWATGSYATLVYAKGYTNAGNNGLKPVTADTATSGTSITVGSGLTAETPPKNATLQIAGVRVLDDQDLTLTVTSGTATLVSASAITNWATLGLRAGMFIHIGGVDTTTGAVQNGLGAGGTTSYGYARITSISGATINLDKLSSTLSTQTGPASGSQDILFGRFLRNVPVGSNSDDNLYLDRTYQMEVTYDNLGTAGADEYEYSVGNYVNEMSLNIPLTEKATINYSMIGTNTEPVTATRKTGPSTVDGCVSPLRTTAFNTSSDVASITTDVISLASNVCFKSLTLTLNNSVSPEKCIGTLGATFMNSGLFEVNLEGQMLFTDKSIVNAIRNNTTVTFTTILRNQDGAIAFDMPELTLSGGGREFPVDQSVLVNITGNSYTSSTYGYDVGISVFPVAPWA